MIIDEIRLDRATTPKQRELERLRRVENDFYGAYIAIYKGHPLLLLPSDFERGVDIGLILSNISNVTFYAKLPLARRTMTGKIDQALTSIIKSVYARVGSTEITAALLGI